MTRSLHSTRPPDFASWGGTPMIRYYVPYDPFAPENEPARAGGSGRLGQRIFDEVMRGSA